MAQAVDVKLDVKATAKSLAPKAWLLLALAVICLLLAAMTQDRNVMLAGNVAGVTFAVLVVMIRGVLWREKRAQNRLARDLSMLMGHDVAPCFTTNEIGRIGFQNDAAVARFGAQDGTTLIAAMQDHFANPSSVLFRLQNRALHGGFGREDVVTRRGHTRLSVHHIGQRRFLWRLEEFVDRSGAGRGAEMLSLPMLIANKSGVVLFSNEAMRRLLGGRPKHLDRVFATKKLNSGEEIEVTAAHGNVRAILAEVEGPSERREIYLLPVDEREQDQTAVADFENVPVALMKFGSDGSLRAANRAARELLDLGTEENIFFHDLFEGLGRSVADWLADIAVERAPSGSEVLRLRKADSDAFYQITLRRVVEAGRASVLAVLNDATALKTLEAQFVQSQKMQAIGQLAGGIAHDFNNLLTAISGHCDLLLLRHDRADPEYADLVQIHQNANRAAALVGQLLAFSRKQTLKLERVDLQDALSDLTHLLARLVGERIQLKLAHAIDLGPIRADRRQLEQVVMNLVVNARDAMPEGGTIRIETEALHLTEEMRRDRAIVPVGEYAVIRVLDTGCGIPEDRLQKIFEPFFTTKRVGDGTGLGLSTAYGIVKQSGGFIFVDSAVGQGSAFHLYFPIQPAMEDAPSDAPVGPRKSIVRQGEGVVLLVEDEAPVRAFASRALRLRGYTVLEADCAEQALKTLEDSTLDVDIFVTDVVMPGMDGPSWVRIALEHRPNARVVFMSGYAEECLSENQARIPNSTFLPKPFSLTQLTEMVQMQLH